jgi:hypothetical protein
MMKKTAFILCLACLIAVEFSCRKPKTYPEEPIINFKDFSTIKNSQGLDASGKISISFTDGDGDIGLNDGDTLAPYDSCSIYQFNYYIKIFEKKNGVFKQFIFIKNFNPCVFQDLYHICSPDFSTMLDSTYNARLKNITPETKSKALSGDIDLDLPFLIPCVTHDTVKFTIYIYDRALHKSNEVESPEYVISTQ